MVVFRNKYAYHNSSKMKESIRAIAFGSYSTGSLITGFFQICKL